MWPHAPQGHITEEWRVWHARCRLDARMSSVVHRLTVVILAAGEGKRMRSRQPKVFHSLCGRPLIAYPLRAAHALADRFVVVAPPETPTLREALPADIRIV